MARKLRIAVWYNLPSGGAKRALYNHLSGLRARGHTIEAFRPPVPHVEFSRIADVVEVETEIPMGKWQKDSRLYPLKLILAAGEAKRFLRAMRDHAIAAADPINRGKFDVLFANTCRDIYAPGVGRHVQVPKLLYLQEPNRKLYEPLPRLPWLAPSVDWDGRIQKLKSLGRHYVALHSAGVQGAYELENAKTYDRILVNSYFSREALLRAYGLNSKVCYLGVDGRMFQDQGLAREGFVVGIGTLGPTKNVLLAIEGVGQVPEAIRPELKWIANMTDEPYLAACFARAKELNVRFTPCQMIPDEELVSLLNRAKMMVYAPRLEPFGFAPIEANLCGLPVVAVAEGGVRETVVDGVNGLLVDHDPALMGAAITRLLQDEPLRVRLGKQAVETAKEKWDFEAGIDRIEAELLDVAGRV